MRASSNFFSSLRQRKIDETRIGEYEDTSGLTGEKFINRIAKEQQKSYQKKFAFEKGKYHQCISNPKNPRQRITVQLVYRVIKENETSKNKICVPDEY